MNHVLAFRKKLDEVLLPIIPAGSNVAIFDFPNYGNVGDSAIWLGQKSFLEQHKIKTIHVDDASPELHELPSLPDKTIILITGGGNFGDIYLNHQALRERLISAYPDKRIVQFPQSIHFNHQENARSFSQKLNQHSDFHIITRDEISLAWAQYINPDRSYLAPDIALYLEKLPVSQTSTRKVIALLRNDREKHFKTTESPSDVITADWTKENKLIKRSIKLLTKLERKLFPHKLSSRTRIAAYDAAATLRLRRGCRFLASGSVVITDRLHGHILSTMMGIPNIVLDNSYGKIASFRKKWLTGEADELCKVANSYAQAVNNARAWNDRL
jgi:pyruvyl transferase EpsO